MKNYFTLIKSILLIGIIFTILSVKPIYIYSLDWFKIDNPQIINNGSGFSTYDQTISIKNDKYGNIYQTGFFEGVIIFGSDTLVSSGFRDFFVTKQDINGNYIWAKSAKGTNFNNSRDIAINDNGDIFLIGYFSGTLNLDNISLVSSGNTDIFVTKLDSNGSWQWGKTASGTGFDRGNSIVANDDYCYITGNFEYSLTIGSTTITSAGLRDIFVAKISNSGNWLWVKKAGSSSSDDSFSIATSDFKSIFISGNFSNTATFGAHNLTSSGNRDAFVANIDSLGNWKWAKKGGSSGADEAYTVASYNGFLYVGGYYSAAFTLDTFNFSAPNDKDIWLAKYNNMGNLIWAKTIKGTGSNYLFALSTDTFGNLFGTGGYDKNITIGSNTFSSNSIRNLFYFKTDLNGVYSYSKVIKGNNSIDGLGISVNNSKNLYIVGTFLDKIYFNNDTIASKGHTDIFNVKLDSNGNISSYKCNYAFSGLIKLNNSEVDKYNNIVLVGYFYGDVVFGKDTLRSLGGKDGFISKYNVDIGFIWTSSISSLLDDEVIAVAVDSSNNYVYGGYYSKNLNINNTNYSNAGGKDIFFIKTNDKNNNIWVRTYGNTNDQVCTSISILNYSNPIIAGNFSDTLVIGSNQIVSINNSQDIFVASFNSLGNNFWCSYAYGQYMDYIKKIVSNNNSIYISGSFDDKITFGSTLLTSNGGEDAFIAKINTFGNWLWSKNIGSPSYQETANALALDNSGNIYLGMNFNSLMQFNGEYIPNYGNSDFLIVKYSVSGNVIWRKNFGSNKYENINSLKVYNNKVYYSGAYTNSLTLNNFSLSSTASQSSFLAISDTSGIINYANTDNGTLYSDPVNILPLNANNYALVGNFLYNIAFNNLNIKEDFKVNQNFYLAFYGIEPISFSWKVKDSTGSSSVVKLPVSINPKINNQNIKMGDAVGVFYTRNSNLYCAGYGIWSGSDLSITVWGDDSTTLIKDGMSINEPYQIKAWDSYTGLEYLTDVRYSTGPDKFMKDSLSIISKFPYYYDTLTVNLVFGWNVISSNVIPKNTNIDSIFKNIRNDIVIVKRGNGAIYIPAFNINNIGTWKFKEGYQVYVNKNTTLKIVGTLSEPTKDSIFLLQGWHLISYLRNTDLNIVDAMQNISGKGKMVIVKNETGKVYLPSYNINTIGNILVGKGYFAYLIAKDTLIYPTNSMGKQTVLSDDEILDFEPVNLPSLEQININNSTLIINSNQDLTDNEIAIYNTKNNLVGTGKFIGKKSVVTLYANDDIAEKYNLAATNDKLIVKLYNKNNELVLENNEPYILDLFNNSFYDGYQNDRIYSLDIELNHNTVSIYPNPASDYIKINLNQTIGADFNYQIFDLSGQSLAKGNQLLIDINSITSGVYFIEFTNNSVKYKVKFIKN